MFIAYVDVLAWNIDITHNGFNYLLYTNTM